MRAPREAARPPLLGKSTIERTFAIVSHTLSSPPQALTRTAGAPRPSPDQATPDIVGGPQGTRMRRSASVESHGNPPIGGGLSSAGRHEPSGAVSPHGGCGRPPRRQGALRRRRGFRDVLTIVTYHHRSLDHRPGRETARRLTFIRPRRAQRLFVTPSLRSVKRPPGRYSAGARPIYVVVRWPWLGCGQIADLVIDQGR